MYIRIRVCLCLHVYIIHVYVYIYICTCCRCAFPCLLANLLFNYMPMSRVDVLGDGCVSPFLFSRKSGFVSGSLDSSSVQNCSCGSVCPRERVYLLVPIPVLELPVLAPGLGPHHEAADKLVQRDSSNGGFFSVGNPRASKSP